MEINSSIYPKDLKFFHERISFVLDICKYSNSDISKILKTASGNISKLRSGQTKSPGFDRIKEICDLLNINPNFLFGYSNIPFRKTYADAVIDYMAPLEDEKQREILRVVKFHAMAVHQEKIEFGLGPI